MYQKKSKKKMNRIADVLMPINIGIFYRIEFKIESNSYLINDKSCSWLIDIFILFDIGIFYVFEFKIKLNSY